MKATCRVPKPTRNDFHPQSCFTSDKGELFTYASPNFTHFQPLLFDYELIHPLVKPRLPTNYQRQSKTTAHRGVKIYHILCVPLYSHTRSFAGVPVTSTVWKWGRFKSSAAMLSRLLAMTTFSGPGLDPHVHLDVSSSNHSIKVTVRNSQRPQYLPYTVLEIIVCRTFPCRIGAGSELSSGSPKQHIRAEPRRHVLIAKYSYLGMAPRFAEPASSDHSISMSIGAPKVLLSEVA